MPFICLQCEHVILDDAQRRLVAGHYMCLFCYEEFRREMEDFAAQVDRANEAIEETLPQEDRQG